MFYRFFLLGISINSILFYSYNKSKLVYITLNVTIISYLLTYHLLY